MREKTCCFTGHRDIPEGEYESLMLRTKSEIARLAEMGYTQFIAGGAIGFDTLAARAVLGLKDFYPEIRLHLVIPCKRQDIYWTREQRAEYAEILELADSSECLFDSYTKFCMAVRNRKMIELSSAVIAYYRGGKGGTAMTLDYAKKEALRIIKL